MKWRVFCVDQRLEVVALPQSRTQKIFDSAISGFVLVILSDESCSSGLGRHLDRCELMQRVILAWIEKVGDFQI